MKLSKKFMLISRHTDEQGFTLVELMISLFISGMVMVAVVSLYVTASKSFTKQDDLAGIQQNLRAALAILSSEIRLAGCDPTESKIPKILVATRTQFQFTRDIRGNAGAGNLTPNIADGDVADADENIAYTLIARNNISGLAVAADTIGADGIMDSGGANWNWGTNTPALGRQSGGAAAGFQPLADNIEALEFYYILDDGTPTFTPPALNKIRAVQISLLARATNPDLNFLHRTTDTYTTASGAVWAPTPTVATQDHFRRRLVITTIQCRNMR